jgi:hypothetical protein
MGTLRELENPVSEVEIVVLVDRPGGVATFPSREEDVISECQASFVALTRADPPLASSSGKIDRVIEKAGS